MTAHYNESEILEFFDLNEADQKEQLERDENAKESSFVQCFFRYKDESGNTVQRTEIVSLNKFIRQSIEIYALPYNYKELSENKTLVETFDGVYIDTFFSGYAVKIENDNAIVAYFYYND